MEKIYKLIKENKLWIEEKALYYINTYSEIENLNTCEGQKVFTFNSIHETLLLSLIHEKNPLNKNTYVEHICSMSGILHARRYREKKINHREFLFLLKYYIQAHSDLLLQGAYSDIHLDACSITNIVFRFIKNGFIMEWLNMDYIINIKALETGLRYNEREWKYLEILKYPVVLVNGENKITVLNRAAEKMIEEYTIPDKKEFFSSHILKYIESEIFIFSLMNNFTFTFPVKINIKNRPCYFNIKMIKILSGKKTDREIAVILSETTEDMENPDRNSILHRGLSIENLVVKIATRFINIDFDTFDSEIEKSLRIIGEYTGTTCIITIFSEDNTCHYEWFPEGTITTEYSQSSNNKKFPWLMEMIEKGKTIYIPRVADMSCEAEIEKEYFKKINVKSVLAIPLCLNKKPLGYMGFYNYYNLKNWYKDDIKLLTLLGDIFVNVWHRYETDRQLKKYQENLEYMVAERTYELTVANRQLEEEICSRKKAEAYLNHWLSMEELITNIATRFINITVENFERDIRHSLEAIGKFVEIDRACLYFFEINNNSCNYEYSLENNRKDCNGKMISDFFYSILKKIGNFEEINISSVSSLDEKREDKKLWKSHHIESIFMIPLYSRNNLTGSFCFIMKNKHREWSDEEKRLAKITGEILIKACERFRITKKMNIPSEPSSELMRYHNIIGKSQAMQDIYSKIEYLSDIQSTVLITGESGTGKELIAEALHYKGVRRHKPLIKVNCPALSESLLESELFGHVKGAFTSAVNNRTGRFKQADGGTIFLDEIGDISIETQKKLLRVLQEKEFEPVGSSVSVKVDIRLISATNQDLTEKVRKGDFREDLYYRLEVVEIKLPPLRERKEDLMLISEYFINMYSKKLNKKITSMSDEVRNIFMNYSWPGNIRELEHTVEHSLIFCKGEEIIAENLPDKFKYLNNKPVDEHKESWEAKIVSELKEQELKKAKNNIDKIDSEIIAIKKALEECNNNISKASKILSMSRPTLYKKMETYKIIM